MIDYSLGVCVIGDKSVGKSSFVWRLDKDEFRKTMATIGVDFVSKICTVIRKNSLYNFRWLIWDTAGQERFRSIVKSYFRNGTVFILFYDITNRTSFGNLKYWIEQVYSLSENPLIYLVGSKYDLNDKRMIQYKDALDFSKKHKCKYYEISSKNNIGIDEIIRIINNDILDIILDKTITNEEKGIMNIKSYVNNVSFGLNIDEGNYVKKCCSIS